MLLIWVGSDLHAQHRLTPTELRQRIDLTNTLLTQTREREQKSIAELSLMGQQIAMRRLLLDALSEEIAGFTKEIETMSHQIAVMETDLIQMKTDFAHTIKEAYTSFDLDNFWLSILSAASLQEVWYRAQYYRQFSKYQARQIEMLYTSQAYLKGQRIALENKVDEKLALSAEKELELGRLERTRRAEEKLFNQLKRRSREIRKQIEAQRDALKAAVAEEERQAAEAAVAQQTVSSADFRAVKGKLPWPVKIEEGIVVAHFGESEDPFGNRITNDGIDIQTTRSHEVKSIYAGEVTAVQQLPLSGYLIIVGHGRSYRTVYANLEKPFVAIGEKIRAGQTLGSIRTDPRTGETILNFLIYKAPKTFLNPEAWMKEDDEIF
ncbi:MAG: peptidoglycan DD-metalloendopeptidase family protein [Bacteroidota bacterium]